jgi:rRNA-processing protein FCF1
VSGTEREGGGAPAMELFAGANAVDRILHEARSSSVAMGAILRLVRQRLDTLAGDERARAIEEVELLSRTAERMNRLCVRCRALVRAPCVRPTTVTLEAIVAGIDGALRRRLQREGAIALEIGADREGGGGATIETDPELLWNLVEELVDVGASAGIAGIIRAAETDDGIRLTLELGGWPACFDERELGGSVAGALAARLGATVQTQRAKRGTSIAVELPRAWS